MWKQISYIGLFIIFFLSSGILSAQDENAKIVLSFVKGDSINYCNAFVTAGDTPVKDVENTAAANNIAASFFLSVICYSSS